MRNMVLSELVMFDQRSGLIVKDARGSSFVARKECAISRPRQEPEPVVVKIVVVSHGAAPINPARGPV